MNDWYVEFKERGYDKLRTPIDPVIPIQSNIFPKGNYWGTYHCRDCAITCASFGKTEQQAREINHGSPDERFFEFLGSDGE
jgi:hypothetical protein